MKLKVFVKDFIYGVTKYPPALFYPRVFLGYFKNQPNINHQKQYFIGLKKLGFKRTPWQLVFPGQTAGLIKRINYVDLQANEVHIRFYLDGTIECELEMHRWSLSHWSGERYRGAKGNDILLEMLKQMQDSMDINTIEIKKLFGEKNYTANCIRSKI